MFILASALDFKKPTKNPKIHTKNILNMSYPLVPPHRIIEAEKIEEEEEEGPWLAAPMCIYRVYVVLTVFGVNPIIPIYKFY